MIGQQRPADNSACCASGSRKGSPAQRAAVWEDAPKDWRPVRQRWLSRFQSCRRRENGGKDHPHRLRPGDFRAASQAAGLSRTPEGYTWHHHQDGTTMQLVPSDIHRMTGHTGGFALGR
ncbi:HNH endonuclease [Sorangium sp. So ce118]